MAQKITLNELRTLVKKTINEIAELHLHDAMSEEFYDNFQTRLKEQIKNNFGENSKFYYDKYEDLYGDSINNRIEKLIDNIYEISIKQGEKKFDNWGNRYVPNLDLFIKESNKYIDYIIEKIKNYKLSKFTYIILNGKVCHADDEKFTNERDVSSEYIIGFEDNENGQIDTIELDKIINNSTNPSVFIFDNKQQFYKYLPYLKLISEGCKNNEKLDKWAKLNNFSDKDWEMVHYKKGLKNHFA